MEINPFESKGQTVKMGQFVLLGICVSLAACDVNVQTADGYVDVPWSVFNKRTKVVKQIGKKTYKKELTCYNPGYCVTCGVGFGGGLSCGFGFYYNCPGVEDVLRTEIVESVVFRYDTGSEEIFSLPKEVTRYEDEILEDCH